MTRLVLYLMTAFFVTGCSFTKLTAINADLGKPHPIASALEKWNKQQVIHLQNHQLIPIDYLEKNPEIKGLIINHYLGTGKTYLAIGFAEKNPDHPVIILAPGFLQSHWLEHLEKYGVKNKERYRFFSHDAPEPLVKEDLSNAILILDESHKFIERVRSQHLNSGLYSSLYFNLRKSHRTLALTGTPIYNDIFDLIYQINLVAGKNIFPFNQEEFRIAFSKINTFNGFWRGHLLESLYLPGLIFPTLNGFVTIYFNLNPFQAILSGLFLPVIPSILRALIPLDKYPARDFYPERLKKAIKQYISYYNFDHDIRLYPTQSSHEEELSYNSAQLNFLYKFYDSRLNDVELTQILKDTPTLRSNTSPISQENIDLNSSLFQDTHKIIPGVGREIGNLFFIEKSILDKENYDRSLDKNTEKPLGKDTVRKTIFPEKFKRILATIEHSRGPVVVYSHYYYNGVLFFKQFLDASGYKEKYRIVHPEMSKGQHAQVIHEFNNKKVKILLLHPEITEGISLKGVRQLHFLEVPINSAMQQQIIGRAIRYRSHLHLPKNEQQVAIYIWRYVLSSLDMKANAALRKNWHHNFAELNYYSGFGDGRIQVDKNAKLKSRSPDTAAYTHLRTLSKQVDAFREYVKIFSIENSIYRKA